MKPHETTEERLRERFIELCSMSAHNGTELTLRGVNQIADWWLAELQAHTDRVVKAIAKLEIDENYSPHWKNGFMQALDTSIQIVKNTL